jgi:hypothetical protein
VRSFSRASNASSRCRLRLRFAWPGINFLMPLPPETVLPSWLESWLALLGDFSNIESAEPFRPPRRLPASSAFRPRRDSELALLNTFFTALRGGAVTGEPVIGESIVYIAEAKEMGLCAPRSWNYVGIGMGGLSRSASMPCIGGVQYARVGRPLFCELFGWFRN